MQSISSLRVASMLVVDRSARLSAASVLLGEHKTGMPSGVTPNAPGTNSIFNADHQDVTKQKVLMMEKIGRAFGLDAKDFKDMGALAGAIERELAKMEPEAAMAFELALGKKLGLDELGLSLRDMLESMKDPGGEKDRKVEAALAANAGAAPRAAGPGLDEIGRYGQR